MYTELIDLLTIFQRQPFTFYSRDDRSISPERLPPQWHAFVDPSFSLSEVLMQLWPTASFTNIAQLLVNSVTEMMLVSFADRDTIPSMLYIFERDTAEERKKFGWLGGPPATKFEIEAAESRLGIALPDKYKDFLKVHNGFLREGWGELGIRATEHLFFVSPRYVSTSTSREFSDARWLSFSGDGSGNEQCFIYKSQKACDDRTVLWDHETRSIYHPEPFTEYATRMITQETVDR